MSGCVFLPGDQPLLTRKTLCGMMSAFCAEPDRKSQIFRLCEPQSGTPGSPVLFGADYFEELRSLPEGRGGGAVAKRHAEKVTLFPARHPAELMDADTPDVLAELKKIFKTIHFIGNANHLMWRYVGAPCAPLRLRLCSRFTRCAKVVAPYSIILCLSQSEWRMVDRYDHFPSSILHSQLKNPGKKFFPGFQSVKKVLF